MLNRKHTNPFSIHKNMYISISIAYILYNIVLMDYKLQREMNEFETF